jgi:hypothetical protein
MPQTHLRVNTRLLAAEDKSVNGRVPSALVRSSGGVAEGERDEEGDVEPAANKETKSE